MNYMCIRCNGMGILAIHNGDDDTECPECLGEGRDVVAEYTARYRFPLLLQIELNADRNALREARETYWYLSGRYEETGHDLHGVSYHIVASDIDDEQVTYNLVTRQQEREVELSWLQEQES